MGGFTADPAGVAEVLRGPNGPVARHVIVVAEEVRQATIRSLTPGFPREFLGPTIVKRITPSGDGVHVQVGSAKVKTRPHPIEGNPLLVFDWPKAGGVVYLRHVNHPGSNLGPYLARKLAEAVAAVGAAGRL